MRWTTLAFLLCWGCVPRLDDCGDDTDCAFGRVCSGGYCLPPDAAFEDAQVDQSVVTGDAAPMDAAVDAVPGDAARDAAKDAMQSCVEGETEPCSAEANVCDPGARTCIDGAWSDCEGRVVMRPETCDGLDEDCDGSIDEGFDIGGDCADGLGACERVGQLVCAEGGAQCNESAVEPDGPELCTSAPAPEIDEDCDGRIDEAASGVANWLGSTIAIGISAAQNADFRSAANLDIAVTATHTAVLARLGGEGDRAMALQIFRHLADGEFGAGQTVTPFSGPVEDVALATQGRRFVVAGLRELAQGVQSVEIQIIDPDDEPVIDGEIVSQYSAAIDGLRLVNSPRGEVTTFVHLAEALEIRRRTFTAGPMVAETLLAFEGALGEWDAAARGAESFLIWGNGAGVSYRRWDGRDRRVTLPNPLPAGRPALTLGRQPYLSTVVDGGFLHVARIENDAVTDRDIWDDVNVEPADGALAPDGHLLLAAHTPNGPSVSIYSPELDRSQQRLSLGRFMTPAVIASFGSRGALAWLDASGEISMRAIWTGCASATPSR